MAESQALPRTVGFWGTTLFPVNGMIGAGIFALPAIKVAAVGNFAPWMMLIGALLILPLATSPEEAEVNPDPVSQRLHVAINVIELSGVGLLLGRPNSTMLFSLGPANTDRYDVKLITTLRRFRMWGHPNSGPG